MTSPSEKCALCSGGGIGLSAIMIAGKLSKAVCPRCNGSGAVQKLEVKWCAECQKETQQEIEWGEMFGEQARISTTCTVCRIRWSKTD